MKLLQILPPLSLLLIFGAVASSEEEVPQNNLRFSTTEKRQLGIFDFLRGPPGPQGPPGEDGKDGKDAPNHDHTQWINPLSGIGAPVGDDPSSLNFNRGGYGTTLRVTSSTSGDFKWVKFPVQVPSNMKIKTVQLCYKLDNSESFISSIRVTEEKIPPSSVIKKEDGTVLTSTNGECVTSEEVNLVPAGSVGISLRLNFASVAHKIEIGAIGIDLVEF